MFIAELLWFFLVFAAVTDVRRGKIYNWWIMAGTAAGLFFRILGSGLPSLGLAGAGALFPLVLLYPFFKIGGLGAGDLKLLAMAGVFLSPKSGLVCFVFSFVIGGIFALLRMFQEKDFWQRMSYLASYIFDLFRTKQWKLYRENREGRADTAGRIHFALPVLISVTCHIGGLY